MSVILNTTNTLLMQEQQLAVPLQYVRIFLDATDVEHALNAKLLEWVGCDSEIEKKMRKIQIFLQVLLRLITDPAKDSTRKWNLICSLFSSHIDKWEEMNSAIRYRRVIGIPERQQIKRVLKLRKQFRRIFLNVGEELLCRFEIRQFSEGSVSSSVFDWMLPMFQLMMTKNIGNQLEITQD